MNRRRQQTILLSMVVTGVFVVMSILASLFYQIPTLQVSQQELENSRIQLAILERQAASNENVDQKLAELDEALTSLDQHLWEFTNEETFFTRWDSFGQANGVTVEIDEVAEVVPSDQPIIRSARLILQGSYRNILNTISNLQAVSPLLSISDLTLQPDPEDESLIQSQITLESVWQ